MSLFWFAKNFRTIKGTCLAFIISASMFGDARGRVSEKVRELKLTKLIAETTIFELTPEGKVPVNSFQSVLEKEWPKKLATHEEKKLGMKIVYIWTKTNSPYYSFGEKSVREMDTFTLNVHRVEPVYRTYSGDPIVDTFTLNFSGFQHIVSEPVRVLNLDNTGENFTSYELHIKVKQISR